MKLIKQIFQEKREKEEAEEAKKQKDFLDYFGEKGVRRFSRLDKAYIACPRCYSEEFKAGGLISTYNLTPCCPITAREYICGNCGNKVEVESRLGIVNKLQE